MVQIFKKLFAPKVQPLNLVTVSRKKILHNLYHLQMLQPGLELFPVIKSNAYGHGIELMCKLLAETTISTVCVDSFIEYQYVEKHTTKDILLLGETNHHNYSLFDFKRTIFAVSNLDTLNYLIGLKRTIRIHLFVNTGMNREGFSEKDLKKSLLILPGSKLKVDGVMSHFHSADLPNMKSMKEQVSLFKKYYHRIEEAGFSPKYRHISASAGILKLQDSFFNAGRPGIAMYGYNPLLKKDKYYKNGEDLQPALEVFTTVVGIQKVKSGEGVSYGYTHVCKENAILATIPFGYYEGLDRRLSNILQISYKKKLLSLRGRVCMNLSSIEVTGTKIQRGDSLRLISSKPENPNTVTNIAKHIGTIEYEVLTNLRDNIRRELV